MATNERLFIEVRMAQKSKSNSGSVSASNQNQMQFVNYDLTVSDKATLKKAGPLNDDVLKTLAQLAKEGYKVSISWDSYSDCVQAFLIGASSSCVNHGFILTSRANELSKALAALVFKHSVVFDGVWHDRVITDRPSDDF
jgi:hypothetical protein